MTRRITYFFDGGCRPNPGAMEVAVVSAGRSWFRYDLETGDNNEAEWAALLFAIDLAIAAGTSDALFIGDSAVVVEQASGRQPCRSPQLRPYVDAFRSKVPAIARFQLKRVPRSKNLAGIALARTRLHLPIGPADTRTSR